MMIIVEPNVGKPPEQSPDGNYDNKNGPGAGIAPTICVKPIVINEPANTAINGLTFALFAIDNRHQHDRRQYR